MWSRRSAVCAARILVSALAIGCGGDHPKHLVFISLDTVRRDHVSTYGYSRETTPRIDELAESAVVFENAFAQQTNTNPSHASR